LHEIDETFDDLATVAGVKLIRVRDAAAIERLGSEPRGSVACDKHRPDLVC
jgi:hypothetical protein